MSHEFLMPMLVHVMLTAMLYALLTLVRAPKVWGLDSDKASSTAWNEIEPRVSANLSNQFEWPVFFYAACIILMLEPELYKPVDLLLAWIFVVGRFLHSGVQILTTNIRLRGMVFTINFLAVLAMWVMLGISAL